MSVTGAEVVEPHLDLAFCKLEVGAGVDQTQILRADRLGRKETGRACQTGIFEGARDRLVAGGLFRVAASWLVLFTSWICEEEHVQSM